VQRIVLERDDSSPEPPACHNLVPGLQFPQHGLPLFLFPALCVEHVGENQNNGEEQDESRESTSLRCLQCNESVYMHLDADFHSQPAARRAWQGNSFRSGLRSCYVIRTGRNDHSLLEWQAGLL